MRYFLKYLYYIPIAFAFACVISALSGAFHTGLFPISITMLYFLRLLDDYFDYDTDDKDHPLDKHGLLMGSVIFGIIFLGFNIGFYLERGLMSIALIIYMIAENYCEWLKPFLLPLSSLFYLSLLCRLDRPEVIIYLAASTLLSAGFMIYKRRKRR